MKLARLADRLRRRQIEPEATPGPPVAYQLSRARRETAAAELARMELRRRAAELMETAAVRDCLAAVATEIREELARLPAAMVEAIRPAAGDEAAIRSTMQREIEAALHRLCARLGG